MALSYHEAVQRLLWLGHEGRSLKWDLANIRAVLERLGYPERKFPGVHIAGTNGKGSVAAMIASILRAAGYRTGLYTSPHLVEMNERIGANGGAIAEEDFAGAFGVVSAAIEALLAANRLPHHPSYFECLTAMGLWHFAQAEVEVAVLEVGLGGRLDATNVVTPELAVITPIDFDHERYLGHSIEQIAAEKAGILKPGVAVINAAAHPVARKVVAQRAAELGAPVVDVKEEYSIEVESLQARDCGRYEFTVRASDGFGLRLAPSLRGSFQVENALVAVAAARQLAGSGWRISEEAIAGGARQVLRFWGEHLPGRRIHLVYGTLRDKAVDEVAEMLFPTAASVTVTQPATPRAASSELLAQLARGYNPDVVVRAEPADALQYALERAEADEVVFVTGSLFLVGDCKRALASGSTEARTRAAAVATNPLPAEKLA
jgi:dihydrofolate synthase/folylpolyglutamate synthase